jgi:ketosteroid isomerase-like protein
MSQENVEVVRAAFEAWDTEDLLASGEALWDALDSEIEIYDHDIPDVGSYRGHEGFLSWILDWGDAWEQWTMETEWFVDAGDRVIYVFQMNAKGKGSGVALSRRDAMVWTIRDEKAVRIDYYNSEAQALEAVGLSEQETRRMS